MTPEERRIKKMLYAREWRKNNPEKAKECHRKHYLKNQEKIIIASHKYRKDNPEKMKIASKKKYLNNRDELLLRNKKWREDNPEKMKEYRQRPETKKRSILADQKRQGTPKRITSHRKWSRSEKGIMYNNQWRKDNPESSLKTKLKKLKTLGDNFCMKPYELEYALHSWVLVVKKNLGKKCVICGTNKIIHIHHIFFKKQYPKLSLNPNNGIPLCHDHHWEVHRLNPIICGKGWKKKQ